MSTGDSTFVFHAGEGIEVGNHGTHKFVVAGGEAVLDNGESEFVFESGTGIAYSQPFPSEVFYDITNWSDTYDPLGLGRIPKWVARNLTSGGAHTSDTEQRFTLDQDTEDAPPPDVDEWDYYCGWEDLPDNPDYNYDCNIYWREPSPDYIEVKGWHEGGEDTHELTLGETRSAGYEMDQHTSDSEFGYFEGRMYANGDVTDLNGNLLGSWN